jgi:hypothetical protein
MHSLLKIRGTSWVHLCVCVCLCVHVNVFVCMYLCVRVRVCACLHVYVRMPLLRNVANPARYNLFTTLPAQNELVTTPSTSRGDRCH